MGGFNREKARVARLAVTLAPAPLDPRWPLCDATVRDHGFDPRAGQIDNGITHARENRKDER